MTTASPLPEMQNLLSNLDHCQSLCSLLLVKLRESDQDEPGIAPLADNEKSPNTRSKSTVCCFKPEYKCSMRPLSEVFVAQVGLMMDGTTIDSLVVGGPAFRSGQLERGDIILAVDHQPVDLVTGRM